MSYIVIPIFSDPFLHPLHKNNGLSLLYVKELSKDSQMVCHYHPDCGDVLQNYEWLENEEILTPDAKKLLSIYPFKNVTDMNYEWWSLNNQPFDMENIRNNAYDFFHNKYYNAKKLNEIIPIVKHKEYCDTLEDKMSVITVLGDKTYSDEATAAFLSIEKNGIKVSDDVCDIFDERVRKHISEGKLYTKYNLWTSTGRPSNSFGSVNFAALTPEQRKAFIPENDYLVEFDYDAYHVRLIGSLIGYTFPQASVHEYLSSFYGSTYEESKQITFKILYGGIPDDVANSIPFFKKTKEYTNELWSKYNRDNFIETDIYKRKLIKKNYTDMNRSKLLNYFLQSAETEHNIKTIIELQRYLYEKKTQLVLYGYDSFTIDYNNSDGVETLKEIKKILERNGHLTKAKAGANLGELQSIQDRL